jgi:hypothetical protein
MDRCETHGTVRNANGRCFWCDHPETLPDPLAQFDAADYRRLQQMEMKIVQLLAHEMQDGDDKTAEQLVTMLLEDRNRLHDAVKTKTEVVRV